MCHASLRSTGTVNAPCRVWRVSSVNQGHEKYNQGVVLRVIGQPAMKLCVCAGIQPRLARVCRSVRSAEQAQELVPRQAGVADERT